MYIHLLDLKILKYKLIFIYRFLCFNEIKGEL